MAKTKKDEQEQKDSAKGKYDKYNHTKDPYTFGKKNIRLIQLQQLHRHSLKLAYPVILPAVLHFEA